MSLAKKSRNRFGWIMTLMTNTNGHVNLIQKLPKIKVSWPIY